MNEQRLLNYLKSAERALVWLSSRLHKDGSYGPDVDDLACYYKAPYLFYQSGRIEDANRVLSYIKRRFMQADGDFKTSRACKSANGALNKYWAYINGWLAVTAQKMGRFDVAYPAYRYLQAFYHPKQGGFTTTKPYGQGDDSVDVLSTAHLGLAALYFGELDKAKHAGELLERFLALQPKIRDGFYLRMDNAGQLVTAYPQAASMLFEVSTGEPNQAYFMIGYPIAFLGKLHQAAGDLQYLATARRYFDFALSCREDLRRFHFSHKVAWGAAILANLTRARRCADLATAIADYLLSIQDTNGGWLQALPAHTSYDQTAEIGIWLKEISLELRSIQFNEEERVDE